MPIREAFKRILNEEVEAEVHHATFQNVTELAASGTNSHGNRVGFMNVGIKMSPALHKRLPGILREILAEPDFKGKAIQIYRMGDKQKNSITEIMVTVGVNPAAETRKMLND